MSSTFFQSSLARDPRKRSRAPSMYQASAPSSMKASRDPLIDDFVLQDLRRTVTLLAHEHRDRHAPGALTRDHPVRPAVDHAVDAVLARRRHPLVTEMACSARARKVSPALALPFSMMSLSIAMNHCGVLRKITGFFDRQECGYWCFKRPRASSMPFSIKALITASLASPFSPLSLRTRFPVKPGACAVSAPFSSTV